MSHPGLLVSVIIPCYNQAHFLGEAIESVLGQTYPHYEIIVVDDGSTDNTATVAARYPAVRYVRQENQGTAAARNRGFQESGGGCLVFLDADDRLLPAAFETALNWLTAHPECGFVFGLCRYVADDGSFAPVSQEPPPEAAGYPALLRKRLIWHPAAVMCRRAVFDSGLRFDTSLVICPDYGFYLRVARRWPIRCHDNLVSEYRQHGANQSRRNARMLKETLSILRAERPFIKGNREYEKAYRSGIQDAWLYYFRVIARRAWSRLSAVARRRPTARSGSFYGRLRGFMVKAWNSRFRSAEK